MKKAADPAAHRSLRPAGRASVPRCFFSAGLAAAFLALPGPPAVAGLQPAPAPPAAERQIAITFDDPPAWVSAACEKIQR